MNNKIESIVFDFLKQENITYKLFEHQPVFTVHDLPVITKIDGVVVTNESIPKPHCKTLLLKDTNKQFFLVSVTENKRVDLKTLSKTLNSGRFSFGSVEELFNLMKLQPGSVSPFGLIFDTNNQITFILDEDISTSTLISFHPLRNDMTVILTVKDFIHCMEKLNHQPRITKIITM